MTGACSKITVSSACCETPMAGQFGDRHVEMRQHIFAQDFAWVGRRDVGPFVDGFEGDVKGHGGPWD
ncbi:MAG: hypothetical protein IPL91_13970 [Hyphomicrobium sp.]|nr:hypothetical protein [Hyphomicrobium sp.]